MTTPRAYDPARHALLHDERLRRAARMDLRTFVELAWPILEPGTPFVPNWHIDLICEYLEAVTAGTVRRLLITMPPRYGKSLLTSVIWPTWEWLTVPTRRWLFVSHSEGLAATHALSRRRLILSEVVQAYGTLRLVRDQHAKMEFHNTRRGTMTATSMGGAVTGKGGNRLVIDDPHSPGEADREVTRNRAQELFRHTFLTRLNDKRRDALVVVQQRLHVADLAALCLELGFTHLSLPALAPVTETIVFPRSGRIHVRQPDEPLWPAREDRAQLDQIRREQGTYTFAAQYQQNPIPRTGGVFQRDWWRDYDHAPTEGRVIISCDLSFKDGETNDYCVMLVARQSGSRIYLLHRVKARMGFIEAYKALESLVHRFTATVVLVEEAANGQAVIETLKQHLTSTAVIGVTPRGGKHARAWAAQPWVEGGQVFLPRVRTTDGECWPDRRWVEDFVDQTTLFPRGKYDDDVDACTQLIAWCEEHRPPVIAESLVIEPPASRVGRYERLLFGHVRPTDWPGLPSDEPRPQPAVTEEEEDASEHRGRRLTNEEERLVRARLAQVTGGRPCRR